MKKYLLVIAFLIFVSCSTNSNTDSGELIQSSELIGNWYIKSSNLGNNDFTKKSADIIKFTSGKRVAYTYFGDGIRGSNIYHTGVYSITLNKIKIIWDESDKGNTVTNFTILILNSSVFKLESITNGEILTENYTR